MSTTLLEALSLQDEVFNEKLGLCGLCGNNGVVDTVGQVYSPAGIECGVTTHCICANGRALKSRGYDVYSGATSAPKAKVPQPTTFWVSWEAPFDFEEPKRDERVIDMWVSGQGEDYCCVVAWIEALTFEEMLLVVGKSFPMEKGADRRWRFVSPHDKDFVPNDRFVTKNRPSFAKKPKRATRKAK